MGAGALTVVEFGLFDTTSTKPHMVLVDWATHATFIHSTKLRAAKIKPPGPFTPTQVTAGFQQYDADCVVCHGGPGVARAHWVRGMTPTPPFLLDAANRWTPAELYWIISQGAKMTAMPAWSESRTDTQMWNTVAFLEALPKLSPGDYARMKAAIPSSPKSDPSAPPARSSVQ
jgi:mono/diheme cytochrome c family protein